MKKIAERRAALDMTQKELAERLDVTPGAVWQWETGKRDPDLDHLALMADILGCTIDELVRSRGKREPKKKRGIRRGVPKAAKHK